VKKLISIAVALALVAVVVLPLGVAAQDCSYDGIMPTTYAKIPFAIIQSGFHLAGQLLTAAGSTLGLPDWINAALLDDIGSWAGGPLSWSVDMLGWGMGLVGAILSPLSTTLGLPTWLPDVITTIVCGMFSPYACNVTGSAFTPCA